MINQSSEAVDVLIGLFSQWKSEHEQLSRFVRELSVWATQDSQSESPNFSQAAVGLRKLDQRLVEHFEKEQAIGLLLADARGTSTPEVEAVQRQADKDHLALQKRLHELIEKIDRGPRNPSTWNAAIEELNLFLDVLEQHEELESENVRSLIPTPHPT